MKREKIIGLVVLGVVLLVALVVTIRPPHRLQPSPTPVFVPSATRPAATPQATRPPARTPTGRPAAKPSPTPQAEIHDFYAAPDGTAQGDGSRAHPWDLQTALDQPAALKPGDTLWLLGGTYTGEYFAHLQGAPDKPVTVRACTDQRVILQSERPSQTAVLMVDGGGWVDYWGMEFTANPSSERLSGRDGRAEGEAVGFHSKNTSSHVRFINTIVHDMPGLGFGFWKTTTDSAIIGSVIYFNGTNQFDHGIYTQNSDGSKLIAENIIFDNASHGIHAYGEGDTRLDNYVVTGNTVFNNGSIGYNSVSKTYGTMMRNILIGGSLVAANPQVTQNYTYYPGRDGTALNIGFKAGSQNAVVEDNVFAGGTVKFPGQQTNLIAKNNMLVGGPLGLLASLVNPGNSWLTSAPRQPQVFVRQNPFESNRANVTIFNWTDQPEVILTAANLQALKIQPGDRYELHSVQDYFVDVQAGTYDGRGIVVPMEGHSIAQPLGLDFKPPSTFPRFGAFVLFVNPEPVCGAE